MRTLKNVVGALVLSLTLFSCSNNEEISLDGTINGTIYNYSAGVFDAIECLDQNLGTSFGRCTPTADGKFSIKLSTPTTLNHFSDYGTVLTISDPTTKYVQTLLVIYKNNNMIGLILNCNFTTFAGLSSSGLNVGNAYTTITYSDKNCTIKGSNISISYDMTLKKGWNQVAGKKINSSTMSGTTTILSGTTTIPSDLKWRYFLIPGMVNLNY